MKTHGPIAPRFPLEFPVIFSAQATSFQGQTENLSTSGLAVGFPGQHEVPKGTRLELVLELDSNRGPSKSLKIAAEVVWSEPGRLGLKICAMDDQERVRYEDLINGYQMLCRGLAQLERAG